MKNLYILSTDKPSRYALKSNEEFVLSNYLYPNSPNFTNYHIYITSDEEIKEGDVVKIPCGVGKVKELTWKFGNDNPSYIVEDIFIYKLRYGQKEGELQINSFRYEDVKKIVITTDQDLIKDGVQAIDDEFLEWFVKNPICEEVEVELLEYGFDEVPICKYKIIIPKEEPKQDLPGIDGETFKVVLDREWFPKQETLEEAAKRCFEEMKILNPRGSIKEFIRMAVNFGAKWQQERMYSEEEVLKIIDLLFHKYASSFRVDAKEDFLLSKKK